MPVSRARRVAFHSVIRPCTQGATGARHLVHEDAGESDVLPAAVVGLATGERDLGRDPTPLSLLRHALRGLAAAYGLVEPRGDLGLESGRGAGQSLQGAEHLDARLVVLGTAAGGQLLDPRVDAAGVERRAVGRRCVEHTFDHTGMPTFSQPVIHIATSAVAP